MMTKFDFLLGDWNLEYRIPKSTMSEAGSRDIYLFNSDSKHITDTQVSVTLVLDGEEKEFAYTTDRNGLLALPKEYFSEALHL